MGERLKAEADKQLGIALAAEREAIIASLRHGMQHCEIVKMIRARGAA